MSKSHLVVHLASAYSSGYEACLRDIAAGMPLDAKERKAEVRKYTGGKRQ